MIAHVVDSSQDNYNDSKGWYVESLECESHADDNSSEIEVVMSEIETASGIENVRRVHWSDHNNHSEI